MPQLPAFCDTCGTAFNSGFQFEGGAGSFVGCRSGPCPQCGGMGHVPDGVFKFVGNVIEVLQAPQRTLDELSRLSKILEHARKAKEPSERTARRIEKELPFFQRVADWVRSAGFTPAVNVGLILAAIPVLQSMRDSPKPAEQHVVIQNVINNYVTALPGPAAAPKRPFRATPHPGRNDPCTCGTGKKWKHCCGRAQDPPSCPAQP